MPVEANMSPDTPPDMKLYDKEMIGQLATFMFAGSETTTQVFSHWLTNTDEW